MNVVDDAHSCNPTLSLLHMLTEWKIQLGTEYSKNQHSCEILDELIQNEEYKECYDPINYKYRIFLVPKYALKRRFWKMQMMHRWMATLVF